MDTQKTAFYAHNYACNNCHFVCSKKNDWDRHILTRKHANRANGNHPETQITHLDFTCKCGKTYVNKSGLWKHKKTCVLTNEIGTNEIGTNEIGTNEIGTNEILDNDNIKMTINEAVNNIKNTDLMSLFYNETVEFKKLIIDVVKSNTELQKQNNDLHKQIVEMCKNSNTTINSHNNNSINKTFNLQFFLNEQCKDAMNMSDFANSINLQLSDFESVGELGYVEGITKIMLDRLNSMDIYKRPIHCSDAKREIIYVKDDDKWEKEEKNNPKLRYAIKTISFNNMKLMGLWSSTYPESMDGESRLNDKYMKLIKQSTGGNGEIADSENKIIRRIAKEILIDKTLLYAK